MGKRRPFQKTYSRKKLKFKRGSIRPTLNLIKHGSIKFKVGLIRPYFTRRRFIRRRLIKSKLSIIKKSSKMLKNFKRYRKLKKYNFLMTKIIFEMKIKNYLYKKFSLNLSSNGGRNRMGRITLPHRGSKCALRRKFINLDLKYSVYNLDYVLLQIKSVSRRTAYAGLILYKNGLFSYILIENTSK